VIGSAQASDLYGDWNRIREVHEAGAVLVRPDGYVAWCHPQPVWEEQAAAHLLQDALTSILEDRSRQAVEAEHPAIAQASDQDRSRT
jgi:2,4-dichlorophenol 6-monooxygenase